ncbi:MAG TPA: hypothetical protein VF054_15790 [Micromonosporaceae bacterium]
MVTAHLEPVDGATRIARLLVDLAEQHPDLAIAERAVNGQPRLVAQHGGATVTVFAFDIAAGRITRIWAARNPDKLRPWASG